MKAKALDIKCPGCGSKIIYNPVIGKFYCKHCSGEFNIEDIKIKNYKNDNLEKYKCNNCGAEIILDDTIASTECLYCGNTAIIKERLTGEFRPDFIVPFRTTKEHIYEQFKVLEKNNTQIDKNFIQNMKIKRIKPVYIPYFLYSFNLSARCTLAYQNQNNGQFFFKEKKARIILKDVPMDGSVELDDDTMATLFPYNLEDKLEYNDAYLSGWHAEMYDEPKEKITNVLIERAKTVMRRYFIRKKHCTSVAVDNPYVALKQIKYILLPVWIIEVEHKKQIIKFYMNGQTKELITKTDYNTNYVEIVLLGTLIFVLLYSSNTLSLPLYLFIMCILILILKMISKNKKIVEDNANFKLLEDISVVKEELYK